MTRVRLGEPLPYTVHTTASRLSYHRPTRTISAQPGSSMTFDVTLARADGGWSDEAGADERIRTWVYLDRCNLPMAGLTLLNLSRGVPHGRLQFAGRDSRDGRWKIMGDTARLYSQGRTGALLAANTFRLEWGAGAQPIDGAPLLEIGGLAFVREDQFHELGVNPTTTPAQFVQPRQNVAIAGRLTGGRQGVGYLQDVWDLVTNQDADVAFWSRLALRDWGQRGPVLIDYADLAASDTSRFYLMVPAQAIQLTPGVALTRIRVVWREAI